MADKITGIDGGGEQQSAAAGSRIERRKAAKKEKRRQKRKELAAKEREEEEARLKDPEEQRRIQLEEERENERLERERREFEEHERVFLEALAAKRKAEEEEEEEERRRRKALEDESKQNQVGHNDENSDDDWEYVEEGPPEIIWQGNEIIVKKKKVRVKRKDTAHLIRKEDPNRPTSNPLPPQSEAFANYRNGFVASAQQLLDNVAQQTPNFGTEQDKAHCPFHLKTGACRFGSRCSRVHFYPDKSCTLLIKNMYSGPGLAWEQDEGLEVLDPKPNAEVNFNFSSGGFLIANADELQLVCLSKSSHMMSKKRSCRDSQWRFIVSALVGLEIKEGNVYTDEEVERSYEEFYEDVHTEFLKFGEIVNFKVCKNGSSHLRGNVYIHYKSLDSALAAYQSINGRYFAGKQVTCEFIGVTKWKVAICGEYMKSRLKTCSRGTACNFIHCFPNPGGDYEWADVDRPPPNYWVDKMAALFGYSEDWYDNSIEGRNSSKMRTADLDSYYRRSRSRERERERDSSRRRYKEHDAQSSRHFNRHHGGSRMAIELIGEKNRGEMNTKNSSESKNRRTHDSDSEEDWPSKDRGEEGHQSNTRKNMRNRIEVLETQDFHADRDRRDRHHTSTRDSSKHHNRVLSLDKSMEKRDHDNDCREEDKNRHHKQMGKRSRHSSEGLVNSHKESDFKTVEPPKVRERHRSSRGVRSSMEPSETNASAEVLESDWYNETISSGHGERTKSRDIADMDEGDHKKLRERDSLRHQTSCRDSSSDGSYETQSTHLCSPRSKSHDSAYYSIEDFNKQSRWVSDETGLEKQCESERKTSSGDFDRYTGNSNSQDPDSDECHRGRRSRVGGWSSGRKSSDGLEEVNSAEECEEYKEKHKKHRRNSHKQHHRKTS